MKTIRAIGFTLGLLTFVGAHIVEVVMWTRWFGGEHEPWFLNSGHAAAFTFSCLFGVSLVAGWAQVSGGMFAAGACLAMGLVLFLQNGGPGTIFPIVLTVGGLFIAGVSLLGAWLGSEMRRLRFPRT